MATDTGSTVPRWRLGRELAKLRELSDLKTDDIVRRSGCSRSKIYRIETGKSPARRADVEKLCQIYHASAKLTRALSALASETTKDGWWHRYGDVIPDWFSVYVGLEAYATRLDVYEPELVTGLLQTHDYAYAVLRTADTDGDDEEIERRVALRLGRQALLTEPDGPHFEVIFNEAVLRRPVGGPAVMAHQLRHLMQVSEEGRTVLRVLPFSAGEHAAMMGGFTYLRFPDRSMPDVIYHETRTGALYLDKPAERKPYRQMWRDINTRVLTPDASRDLMATIAKELQA